MKYVVQQPEEEELTCANLKHYSITNLFEYPETRSWVSVGNLQIIRTMFDWQTDESQRENTHVIVNGQTIWNKSIYLSDAEVLKIMNRIDKLQHFA